MAIKKINYNEAKKNNDSENQLAEVFSKSVKMEPESDSDIKMIPIDEIQLDPKEEFTKLYEINGSNLNDEQDVKNLCDSMTKHGFYKHQHILVLNILEENLYKICGDGNTRLKAARMAGIEKVPVYEVTFDTRKEALLAMYGLQINRRNLTPGQKMIVIQRIDSLKNPGKKASDSTEQTGKSAEALADQLGMSTRQVEKARAILNSGDEETIAAVESGEKSISAAYDTVKGKKTKSHKEDDFENDEISDEQEDNDGNPRAITVRSRDMSEHFTPPEESEFDRRLIERYREGFASGFKKGFSEGTYQIFDKIISMLKDGKSIEEIENEELFADFTYSVIAPKFEIATDDEEILRGFNK